MLPFLRESGNSTIMEVKVCPKASKNAICGIIDGRLKILVTSVPEKGKANEDVVKLLSKILKIAKGKINIISGDTSHKKTILIDESIDIISRKF